MLEQIFDLRKLGGDYADMISAVNNKLPTSAFGMGHSERIVSALSLGTVLFLTNDELTAKKHLEEFNQLVGDKAVFLPVSSDNLTYKHSQSNENNVERIKAIYKLVKKESNIIVASIDAICSYFPKREIFNDMVFSLKKGDSIDISKLAKKYVSMGYVKQAMIDGPGQFSVRGDILDVFPVNYAYPVRIEFFDIVIQTIKFFDIATQVSKEEIKKLEVCPFTNLFIDESDIKEISNSLKKMQKQDFANPDAKTRFNTITSEILSKLETGDHDFSLDYLFPIIKNKLSTIFDYLPDDATIVFDECKMVFDQLNEFCNNFDQRKKSLETSGELLLTTQSAIISKREILDKIQNFGLLAHQKITNANNFFTPKTVFSFRTSPVVRYTHNLLEFAKDCANWLFSENKLFIFAGDEKGAKHIQKVLEDSNIEIPVKRHASISDTSSCIFPYEFTSGFVLPTRKIVVIGTYDILPRKQVANKMLAGRGDVFSVPKVGDYVVHEVHGIGVCEGITKLSSNFGTKDFIIVRYRDEDRLYVPIDQMNLLDRFSGGDTPKKLSKIGGAEFAAVKEKVEKHLREMAFDLLELYAKRESKKGFVFKPDDMVQKEFENSFAYTETEDQLVSIVEIKKDMMSEKVMDRLLCGDVGFGKTEVALRAAFKAVLSGKQVAFLAPTTILSEQHYNTTRARCDAFGVKVGVLNRFKTEKETKRTLSELESGSIDIICGTHRLLSKDVIFKNLGLIILDEEQKFGVEDKEKIKLDRTNVDVLTLSATPIPRTLHMSLTGIRDVSIISTPPNERLTVQTFVTEYSDGLIKDAISREVARGGQVFVVYNRVETIYKFKDRLQNLLPDVKFVVGHGQLAGNELEDVIYQFYNKTADVLVCTTIIENGIDVPNANTLIVMDSDRFGLSQLYQIRGRVGRSNRVAYAYFTYSPDKALGEDAYKRLDAIAEFTEFGSGFKVAMRDLEIRGAGNVLGAEQHGHIQKVGYDLYCKLLGNVVEELKGNKIKLEKDVLMKVAIDAFIPEDYISDAASRMTIYKNISRIENEEMVNKMLGELDDMYGKVPSSLKNLIDIAYAKSLAKNLGIVEVISNSSEVKLIFEEKSEIIVSEQIASAVCKYSDICTMSLRLVPSIRFNVAGKKNIECFILLKDFLKEANKITKK